MVRIMILSLAKVKETADASKILSLQKHEISIAEKSIEVFFLKKMPTPPNWCFVHSFLEYDAMRRYLSKASCARSAWDIPNSEKQARVGLKSESKMLMSSILHFKLRMFCEKIENICLSPTVPSLLLAAKVE